MTKRTREQRRRLRMQRLYWLMVALMFAAVVALIVVAIRYGTYVNSYAKEVWSATAEVISYQPEEAHTLEYEIAMKEASQRYEWERDPVLYEQLYAKKEPTSGGKPLIDSGSQHN